MIIFIFITKVNSFVTILTSSLINLAVRIDYARPSAVNCIRLLLLAVVFC